MVVGRSALFEETRERGDWNMTARVFNVLFLCVGNSARSIMAEALVNRYGAGRFRAFSAGIAPSREVDPFAIDTLKLHGIDTDSLRSKHWQEFVTPSAPPMDFIISVCEVPAPEIWMYWPGNPVKAHWRIADPAAIDGSVLERRNAFRRALRELENRVRLFLLLRHDEPRELSRFVQSYGAPSA